MPPRSARYQLVEPIPCPGGRFTSTDRVTGLGRRTRSRGRRSMTHASSRHRAAKSYLRRPDASAVGHHIGCAMSITCRLSFAHGRIAGLAAAAARVITRRDLHRNPTGEVPRESVNVHHLQQAGVLFRSPTGRYGAGVRRQPPNTASGAPSPAPPCVGSTASPCQPFRSMPPSSRPGPPTASSSPRSLRRLSSPRDAPLWTLSPSVRRSRLNTL